MSPPDKSRRRSLLSLPQILVLLAMAAALTLVLGLSANARGGRAPREEEAALASRLMEEQERNRQLLITATYVSSDDFVADYARDEGGMSLPGEKRVVPLLHPPPPTPTPIPPSISAALAPATPFEAWWMLFFDAPPPGR